jgi:hypothetical protein
MSMRAERATVTDVQQRLISHKPMPYVKPKSSDPMEGLCRHALLNPQTSTQKLKKSSRCSGDLKMLTRAGGGASESNETRKEAAKARGGVIQREDWLTPSERPRAGAAGSGGGGGHGDGGAAVFVWVFEKVTHEFTTNACLRAAAAVKRTHCTRATADQSR